MTEEMPPSLDTLLESSARGNKVAFQKLYEATSGKLFGGAMRLLRDHGLAQEALQDGFLKIWRKAATFDPAKGSAMAWMGIIVRRAALDKMSAQKPAESLENIEVVAPHIEPGDPGLDKCLKTLPDLHRKALIFSYVYGYTHDEIAMMLQKPVGTIKSWVRRASLSVKKCLES